MVDPAISCCCEDEGAPKGSCSKVKYCNMGLTQCEEDCEGEFVAGLDLTHTCRFPESCNSQNSCADDCGGRWQCVYGNDKILHVVFYCLMNFVKETTTLLVATKKQKITNDYLKTA